MIWLTRKNTKLAAAALLSLGALAGPFGCMRNNPPETQRVAELPVDEAMQHRQWSASDALYANGSVVAYSHRELIKMPLHTHYLRMTGDVFAFVVDSAWDLPSLAVDPLMKPVVYHGYQTPPSYTAVPPVGPDELTTNTR